MKRTSVVTWAIVLVAIAITTCADAAQPTMPHTTPIICATCHIANPLGPANLGTTSQTSPAYYNNTCQSCHRPGDANAGSKPFSSADASIIFGGHTTNAGTSRLQTSHRWDGSDYNPAAGAQPPIQAAMTSGAAQGTQGRANLRGRTGNQLACARCHSMHLATPNTHLTRMANDKDQMCMDCHRSRNQQSHLSGSHPVGDPVNGGVIYSDVAAAKPTKFNASPVNANPANTTSNLGAKLSSTGSIICSTCHGVHYTDSRSSTFDGASSAKGRNNYANLSSGDGYILRTDRRGAKVSSSDTFDNKDKLNICTNCHANKKSHNAANQDVQCNDCHGAHVEYDKDDPSKLIAPNVFLVRRDVTKAGVPKKVYFRYTGSQREYKNTQGTGVCQGCHDVPAAGGKYPPQHDSTKASECNTCHYHGSQAGSFSGACGKCHGNPPTTAEIGGPNGLASPATGALGIGAAGAHDKHVNIQKMNCNVCHNRYANKEMPSNSIDLEFAVNAGTYPGFKGNSINGNYNSPAPNSGYIFTGPVNISAGANRTCSTVYCHGGTLAPGSKSQPSWVDGSSATACGSCHSTDSLALYASHPAHSGFTLGCNTCHPAVTGNDTSHMQGSVQWDLRGISGTAQYKPAGGTYASFGETGRLAPSTTYGTCNNIACHGQGAPTWGASSTVPVNGFPYSSAQCGKCHSLEGDVTAVKPFYSTAIPKVTANTDVKAGAHTAHLKVSTDSISGTLNCAECHGTVTALNSAGHMNGSTDFVWGDLATGKQNSSTGLARVAPSIINGTCSNTYCHGATLSDGTAAGKTPKWNVPFMPATLTTAGCATCHGFPPTGNGHPAFVAPTTFPAAAASCSCHPNIEPTATSYATIFVNKSLHINGKVEGGGCNGCHGYPPANKRFVGSVGNYEFARFESYSGSGGAHTVAGHVSPAANQNDGWSRCTPCHNQSSHAVSPKEFKPSSNIKVLIDSKIRFANAVLPKYSSNKLDAELHVTGTCSSVACHFQKTPKW